MLWAPASDIWQYQLPPTHPVPTFSTLPIDACSSKLSDHKRIAPTHCGFNSGPMNQGKLEVVRQEMTRVNIDILGISEFKWTGMGEYNSDDHYIYYVGKNPLEEME